MKIELITSICDYDDSPSHDLVVLDSEDKWITSYYIHSLSECSEDAIIGRDLIDGYDLINIAKIAWEAGKRGEDFILEEKDED